MNRFLAGGLAAIALISGGLLLWQGQAQQEVEIPAPPPPEQVQAPEGLPEAGLDAPKYGAAPPYTAKSRQVEPRGETLQPL